MLYVPKVNCMYLRYRYAWNTSRYSHKLNSKSSEYCLCGPIHPASGFKTAFDPDILSRGQVMLLSTFKCSHFRHISRVKVRKYMPINMPINCYNVDSHSYYSM